MLKWMLLILLPIAIVGLVLLIWFLSQGAPYVQSADDRLQAIKESVKQANVKRIVDLGSGDGKVVIALAQEGYAADGVELQPWLVWRSRRQIKQLGLENHAKIYWGSMWRFSTTPYDCVVVYAMPHVMDRLKHKLTCELAPKSAVVSNYFVFPDTLAVRRIGNIHTYIF